MSRKNIGVFVAGDEGQLKIDFINGVSKRASQLDCNVIVFDSLIHKPEFDSGISLSDEFIRGETSIYMGHDLSDLDAVVMMGDTLINKDVKNQIIEKLTAEGVPIVDVDDYDERCHCLIYDDTMGMESMIRHVVETHGCRKIDFISGFKGNRQSEERVLAYRKVLEENGIPVEESRIGYGQFGYPAEYVVNGFIQDHGLADAIICANDTMAIVTTKTLRAKGFKVPEDCIVTGFDGIPEGQAFVPSLTTVKRPIETSGRRAIDIAYELSLGKTLPKVIKLHAEMAFKQSCGCESEDIQSFDKMHGILIQMLDNRDGFNYHLSQLTREVALCKNIDDVLGYFAGRMYAFYIDDMEVFLSDDIIGKRNYRGQEKEKNKSRIYSEYLVHYSLHNKEFKKHAEKVRSDEYITKLTAGDEKIFVSIIPLYFRERILGFLELRGLFYFENVLSFYTWIAYISSSIGNLILREEMRNLVESLDNMYVRDQLTGLYNRFGLHRETAEMFEKTKNENGKVFVEMVDLDRLKYINDNYGHEAGDNAINQVAAALKTSSSDSAVISRIGGDEFLVVDYFTDDNTPDVFEKKIREYIDTYNNEHDLEYEVDCSCGYCIGSSAESLEDLMKTADEKMYAIKSAKKKARGLKVDER
ncbi:MAG: GGDEF domain-containing protein [Lachnospiraceae bacterium]|nr:GGDEF domain-containing protein [Lachnospiraceae bacterium]